MTICITGMHRSGTSMVTRLLQLCGLYLGPEERIMPPHPDNPAGYWENLDVVEINDLILERLGGGWDFLPTEVMPGWEQRSELDHLRDRALQLIEGFGLQETWGWKDPRFCFTLPFWLALLPDMKIIVCVRHPLDVAASLTQRNGSSSAFGVHLWQEHYRQLMERTQSGRRQVTHYDVYFTHPQDELRRLVDGLGWSVPEERVQAACEVVSSELRHYHISTSPVPSPEIPPAVRQLYSELEKEAGPIYGRSRPSGQERPVASWSSASSTRGPTATDWAADLPQEAHAKFEEARKLIEDHQVEASITAFESLLAAYPAHAHAHNDVAAAYVQVGRHDQALQHLERAVQLDPQDADTLRNLGQVCVALGRLELGIQAFEKVVELEPADADTLFALGALNYQLGRLDQAREQMSQTLKADPNHPSAEKMLASLTDLTAAKGAGPRS